MGKYRETAQDKRARKAFASFDRKYHAGADKVFKKARGKRRK